MRVQQFHWETRRAWGERKPDPGLGPADLVLVFGNRRQLDTSGVPGFIRECFPTACVIGCSSAGEIINTRVVDDGISVTAISFDRMACRGMCETVGGVADSYGVGERIAAALLAEDLRQLFVFSDGTVVNGTSLVRGITAGLPEHVTVAGGLAGDGHAFEETRVVWDGVSRARAVAAVGLYGEGLRVGYGSVGGWDPFGPERLVTRSEGNVLYSLDGMSALALYRQYLGTFAQGLPAAGLLFPLAIRLPDAHSQLVRTLLKVDEHNQCIVFAGDVPEGAYARLMKANYDRLIDGASDSARRCLTTLNRADTEFALLVSCVGRRMVLKQRVEEELEAVRDALGPGPVMTGFYSYGEIAPMGYPSRCELHNQTMTITTLSEVSDG